MLDMLAQNRMLLLASYIFYGWWDVRFLYLVVLSTGLDYCCGLILGRAEIPRARPATVSLASSAGGPLLRDPAMGPREPSTSPASHWFAELPSAAPFGIDRGRALGLLRPARLGGPCLAGTIVAVLLANLIYYPARSLPETRRASRPDHHDRGQPRASSASSSTSTSSSIAPIGCCARSGSRPSTLHLAHRAAGRDLLLHVPVAELHDRRLPRRTSSRSASLERLRPLRDVLPAPGRRADRARARTCCPSCTTPRRITLDQTHAGLVPDPDGALQEDGRSPTTSPPSVNAIYGSTGGDRPGRRRLAATLLFAFQIYCDFSGLHRHRARRRQAAGVRPDAATSTCRTSRASPSEFWRRWHISLSTWLRDYLYIPLGGNRARRRSDLPQPDDHDDPGRALARRRLELRPLGVLPGRGPLPLPGHAADGSMPRSPGVGPGPGWLAVIRFVASIGRVLRASPAYGWLLFRANSVGQIAELQPGRCSSTSATSTRTLGNRRWRRCSACPSCCPSNASEYASGERTLLPLAAPAPWRRSTRPDRHPLYGPRAMSLPIHLLPVLRPDCRKPTKFGVRCGTC